MRLAILLALAAFAVLALLYVFFRSAILERSPTWASFCAWLDPLVIRILSRSRQMAVARLAGLAGLVVALVNFMSDVPIDWVALAQAGVAYLPMWLQPLAEKMLAPAMMGLFWWLLGKLRKITDKPYEVVNPQADVPPEVAAAAVAHVEQANAAAVATVEAAKA
jgi:phytoene/squalene synthetase